MNVAPPAPTACYATPATAPRRVVVVAQGAALRSASALRCPIATAARDGHGTGGTT